MKNQSIRLQTDSILQTPLSVYQNDFTFNVNQKEYQTTKLVADLLSPIISNIHASDPTMNEYFITTDNEGDFSLILQLVNFKEREIKENEEKFIIEMIEKLGMSKIFINKPKEEITIENCVLLLKQHERSSIFYSFEKEKEIEFISSHFHEIINENSHKEQLKTLTYESIRSIVANENLELDNEDELLSFINELYKENCHFSTLYEYVIFSNVTTETLKNFIDIFDIEYLTTGTWHSISSRLILKVEEIESKIRTRNYKQKRENDEISKSKNGNEFIKEILYSNNKIDGIFSYFRENSSIEEEINFTCSSHDYGDKNLLFQIENTTNEFYTSNQQNSWICFEFKKHRIISTNYSIRSFNCSSNWQHPRNWIIEGSNDNSNWTKIDDQRDNSSLNGRSIVHTFPIKETEESFKFIRMRITGPNWYSSGNNYRIEICSFEVYGKMI